MYLANKAIETDLMGKQIVLSISTNGVRKPIQTVTFKYP